MPRDEIVRYLNNILNQIAERYSMEEAVDMFEETVELAKVISPKKEGE